MPARRRWLAQALAGSAACVGAPGWLRQARGADTARFALGVASGCPRPDSVVLWTRLTGPDLPPQVDVTWELAHDEADRKSTRLNSSHQCGRP
jgi:alkaline phosphatase D